MVDIGINEIYSKSECYPLIAHFQNGYPTDSFADQVCEVLEHKINGKMWLASEINNLVYSGEECEETLGKTFILLRNRKSGKVRILEAGNVEVKPLIQSKIEKQELDTTYIDLGRRFGSKRHKKILEQNEKLKVNENVVMEQLKDVSQNVSVDQLDISSYNQVNVEDLYIPPCNREANKIEDVYMMTAILPSEDYEQIFSELDTSDYKPSLFPYIKEIFNDKWSKEQTVLAVYASVLLTLHNTTMKEINLKKFVASPHSPTLDKIVMRDFFTYSSRGRVRSVQYKDKCICHAIVLLFLVNDYKIDIPSFCKYTKLSEKTASAKICVAGGWPTKQGTKKVAILKLPLNKASSVYSKRKSDINK